MRERLNSLAIAVLTMGSFAADGQNSPQPAGQKPSPLTESGKVVVAGQSTPYLIRHLPVSSFPELPADLVEILNRRGCAIPQTYQAHHPENVIHASLEYPGSYDWALLCSVKGTVSLLVFFDDAAQKRPGQNAGQAEPQPVVLASVPEVQRLQAHDPSGVLGFNWGIDPASPRQVHEAQISLQNPPARLDHDALADSVVDHRTIYHFYSKAAWTILETPD
ncbi:MAG: hypothetical protein ABSF53_15280 [Terracidiphilus sp.]|jgi:hypothetical protein